jgi:Bacterial SH3 domain
MKSSVMMLAGLLGAGALAGGTIALNQPPMAPPPPKAISAAPAVPPITALPDRPAAVPSPIAQPPAPGERPSPVASEPTRAPRQVASCKILMAIVKDSTPLNVRAQPNLDGAIVGTVTDGTFVSVKQERDGWLEISEPAGWIAKSKTASQCGQKVEQVRFGAGQTGTVLAAEFLGVGSHQYKLALGKGQTLRIKGSIGPMPAVIGPDGQYLVGMDEARGTWSTKLPSDGDYTLEMASNFRGYKYEFAVDVQ